MVGEDIRIVILEVRGKQIRLGIEAPGNLVVLREELLERLAQENLQAARVQAEDLEEVVKLWKQG
jgi:carbon storage regulator